MKTVEIVVKQGVQSFMVAIRENGVILSFLASFEIGKFSEIEAKKEAEAFAKKMRKKFQTRINNEEGC